LTETQGITVRPAVAEDLPALSSFYASVGYGGGLHPDDRILVSLRSGTLVAAVRLVQEAGTLVLRGMYVAESLRGTGIGSALLERVSAEIGPDTCWCIPYVHLVDFYSGIGFRVCEAEQIPDFLGARQKKYISAGHDVEIMLRA
jgi:GNAT superfamily N-acetyltransferase